jgi:hypothetical protein
LVGRSSDESGQPPAGGRYILRPPPRPRLAGGPDGELSVSDLVIPFVIHWDGEPGPDLSGIDDPIRVPFRFVPAGAPRRSDRQNRSDHLPSEPGLLFGSIGYAARFLSPISSANAAEPSVSTPGGFSYDEKIERQMSARGWTAGQIDEAIRFGQRIDAIAKATGNPATRYINPTTGQSVVIDNVTKRIVQVGGSGFRFGPESGDIPGATLRPAPTGTPSAGGGGAGDIFKSHIPGRHNPEGLLE